MCPKKVGRGRNPWFARFYEMKLEQRMQIWSATKIVYLKNNRSRVGE